MGRAFQEFPEEDNCTLLQESVSEAPKTFRKAGSGGCSVPEESEKPCTQSVKNPSVQLVQIDDQIPNKIKLLIDYGYVDFMSAKELCKLATQIGRSYGHYKMKTLKDYRMRSHNLSSLMTFK